MSVTCRPRSASCQAASHPARPPPMTSASPIDRLQLELSLAGRALDELAPGLRALGHQEGGPAVRAGLGHGPVPARPVAVRVAVATPEDLAGPGPLHRDVALAALRALDPRDGDRLRVLALRVVAARDEGPEPPLPLDELRAALRALLADRLRRLRLLAVQRPRVRAFGIAGATQEPAVPGPADLERPAAVGAGARVPGHDLAQHLLAAALALLELALEGPVEVLQHLLPVDVALLDLVELALHPAGEVHLEEGREERHQQLDHRLAQGRRVETLLLELDVLAVEQGRDDLGVRGRPADPLLLQLLDQARLAVARRRLGEVLLGDELDELAPLAALEDRERREVVERAVVAVLPRLLVEASEAVELHDRSGRPEEVAPPRLA